MMAYSEAQKKATDKYKRDNYKRIPLDVPKEFYDQIKSSAESQGESVNGFIKKSIEMRLQLNSSEQSF